MSLGKTIPYQMYSRPDDQHFTSFDALYRYCLDKQRNSETHWRVPGEIIPICYQDQLQLKLTGFRAYSLTDWSFGQVCRLASIKKETVNRLKPSTAAQVLLEKMPRSPGPLQIFTEHDSIRAINSVGYTRIHDAQLLELVIDEAFDFDPPPVGESGATGLYAGEQDMYAFMIDQTAWVEVGEERFAPGFYISNSEVGSRYTGIASFWYQRVCGNHIVWDPKHLVSYSRKHTTSAETALAELRKIIRYLVEASSSRRDEFVKSISNAKKTLLGSCPDSATKVMKGLGIAASSIQDAVQVMAEKSDGFTIYNAVDALTRITGKLKNASERVDQDGKIGQLLSLAN